jgi:hypothetical protein
MQLLATPLLLRGPPPRIRDNLSAACITGNVAERAYSQLYPILRYPVITDAPAELCQHLKKTLTDNSIIQSSNNFIINDQIINL